ncbi:class I SAM-dependent methyltransferase [Jiulongibacter sediminis]|uniref:SAM-dependent methyltransferase n=1 Tax=Jiulongibacter sediminis TaxID=1605367 RepID=A0A0P7C3G9_9BACT|nr:class I SAM-dependent methyltransferase [Jiulongibacter sediminis]KPM49183.1 SAM-dependent methyltransferase [Jiulongibacter sediminis]TBX26237.1 SAM-dependent methyltransferase [Jiulongibacter sediminis]
MKKIISLLIRFVPRKYLQLFSHIPLKIYAGFMRGDAVECTVCNGKFKKFLPYGRLEPRENALCPSCLSLERHRLMYLYLRKKTSFFEKKAKVLHVAPEYCFIDRFEQLPNLEYITADIESPLAKVKMDIEKIQFPDNSFDVIFCNHVLEHVEHFDVATKELYRVLKPGGYAIMQSPQDMNLPHTISDPTISDPKERERVFKQSDHLRLFGQDYGQELAKAGFKVKEDDFVHEIDLELAKRYALPMEEIVYFCEKE